MRLLPQLFENNRAWSERRRQEDPEFFARLAGQQAPEHLWIGCSDSRVPANVIVGLDPGELFVHRNVANVVSHSDLNCLSVLQFSVDVLKVQHVIVCGHYGCGGVKAALEGKKMGLVDNWLRNVEDVYRVHRDAVNQLPEEQRHDRLVELNVLAQLSNVGRTTIVQDAWARGQRVVLHGWVYRLTDGLLHEICDAVESPSALAKLTLRAEAAA